MLHFQCCFPCVLGRFHPAMTLTCPHPLPILASPVVRLWPIFLELNAYCCPRCSTPHKSKGFNFLLLPLANQRLLLRQNGKQRPIFMALWNPFQDSVKSRRMGTEHSSLYYGRACSLRHHSTIAGQAWAWSEWIFEHILFIRVSNIIRHDEDETCAQREAVRPEGKSLTCEFKHIYLFAVGGA